MENLNDRRCQMQAALCMGFVFICIGIPIWWKTTEVYRADLPYSEIERLLSDSKISTQVTIKIASTSSQLNKKVENSLKSPPSSSYVLIDYVLETAVISQNDIEIIKRNDDVNEITHMNGITLVFDVSKRLGKAKITFKFNRIILIETDDSEIHMVLKKLSILINENIVNVKTLNDAVSKAYGAEVQFSKEREFHMRKTVQPDKGYDIVFSLLCPEPNKLQATWNIEEAIDSYLKPMITKLGNFTEFHIGSQILYYSKLSVKPKLRNDDGKQHYYLTYQQLSHVVNPIESRLGAQISPNPTLNFVIYMTDDKYHPLYIQHADGSLSTTNTFLVPRWGAIMIKNTQKNNITSLPRQVKLQNSEIMSVFMAQLRSLLGIEDLPNFTDVEIVKNSEITGISDLELEYLVRARTFENIAMSIHTIHSLSQLLEKIHNIVINDNIAELIYSAVNSIKQAKAALANSNLNQALDFSNAAFKASETAFFDPTLLELLYFPEDQKFAIYIPLFLPISLPLLGSFIAAIKWMKGKNINDEKQKSE